MKRILLIGAFLIGLGAILAAGSLAYFTASSRAVNVITTGGIDIDLMEMTEVTTAEGTELVPYDEVYPDGCAEVMPGMSVSKIVTVKNLDGSAESWIRVKTDIIVKGETELSDEMIIPNINTDDWELKDGFYYYKSPLKAGEETSPLFTEVEFDGDMDNEYQNSRVEIDVAAQAVQTKNNGASAAEAAGWPA